MADLSRETSFFYQAANRKRQVRTMPWARRRTTSAATINRQRSRMILRDRPSYDTSVRDASRAFFGSVRRRIQRATTGRSSG